MRYSIYKKDSSDEYHLHRAEGVPGQCRSEDLSICKKSTKVGSSRVHPCLTANEARHKAAEIGETFCGPCVSHLYKTY